MSKFVLQLEQVKSALEKDPNNEDLKKLAFDLQEMIELNERSAALESTSRTTEPIKKISQKVWKVGDVCEARYQSDGKWYEARIQTMTADKSTFVVLYTGYNETEKVSVKDLRPLVTAASAIGSSSSSSSSSSTAILSKDQRKRPADNSLQSSASLPVTTSSSTQSSTNANSHPKKKSKNTDASVVGVQKKDVEHQAKQSNWLNFSAKVARTGKIPAKSIFSSPESIEGKVGVTGSGKRMTDFQRRGKHTFSDTAKRN